MGLKALIKNQTIIIDDHKRGAGEVKDWDDPSADVHIDKSTNFPVDGKRQKLRIKIPINSNRELTIENARGGKLNTIPKQLRREIERAFENQKTRESFISEVVNILKDFPTILSNEDRVRQILNNLSKHFGLQWTEEKITDYSKGVLRVYTEIYTDTEGDEYSITVDKEKIKIGQNNNSYDRD